MSETFELVDLEADHPAWSLALPVLRELRPHLTDELLRQVLAEATPQGLIFTAALGEGKCLGIAGWRIAANTSAIRRLYVDDLVTTADTRSQGVGSRLLAELVRRAREAGCHVLDLDSGVQRNAAHRFYLRERMDIVAHHFSMEL